MSPKRLQACRHSPVRSYRIHQRWSARPSGSGSKELLETERFEGGARHLSANPISLSKPPYSGQLTHEIPQCEASANSSEERSIVRCNQAASSFERQSGVLSVVAIFRQLRLIPLDSPRCFGQKFANLWCRRRYPFHYVRGVTWFPSPLRAGYAASKLTSANAKWTNMDSRFMNPATSPRWPSTPSQTANLVRVSLRRAKVGKTPFRNAAALSKFPLDRSDINV